MRVLILLFGSVSYAIFLVAFLYAIVFVNDFPDVKTVSSGEGGPLTQAIIVNLLLLSLFAIQHTIMARPVFKAWFTKIVPKPAERPTFVLLASLILCLMYWQWRPMPEVIWV